MVRGRWEPCAVLIPSRVQGGICVPPRWRSALARMTQFSGNVIIRFFFRELDHKCQRRRLMWFFFFFFFLSRSLSAEMTRVWLKQPCYKVQNHSSHINLKEGQNRGGPTQVWCVGALCVCSFFYSFTNKHLSLDKRLKLILAVLIIAEQGSFWVDIVCKSTECTRISIIIAIIIKWGRREKHQTHIQAPNEGQTCGSVWFRNAQ